MQLSYAAIVRALTPSSLANAGWDSSFLARSSLTFSPNFMVQSSFLKLNFLIFLLTMKLNCVIIRITKLNFMIIIAYMKFNVNTPEGKR